MGYLVRGGRRHLAIAMAAAACLLALVPAAQAAPAAKAGLVTANGVTRVQVTVTGVTRIAWVRVTVSGRLYRLTKVGARWRSAPLNATNRANAQKRHGKVVVVQVRANGRTIALRPKFSAPPPKGSVAPVTPPVTPGAPALFQAPAQKLTGTGAIPFLQTYFANSQFTDCPGAGWPNCAVEEKYDHCTDGSWSYFRITPSTGSDINSVGSYQVTGAEVNTDGSWGVEYWAQLGSSTSVSFYSWRISATGQVMGLYWPPGANPATTQPSQQLGPLVWERPGNCGQKF